MYTMSADAEEINVDISNLQEIRCPCCCSATFTSAEKLRLHLADVRRRIDNLKCFACSQKLYNLLNYDDHLKICKSALLVKKRVFACRTLTPQENQKLSPTQSPGLKVVKILDNQTKDASAKSFKIVTPTIIAPMVVTGRSGKRKMVQILKTTKEEKKDCEAAASKRHRTAEIAKPELTEVLQVDISSEHDYDVGNQGILDSPNLIKEPDREDSAPPPVADGATKPSDPPPSKILEASPVEQDTKILLKCSKCCFATFDERLKNAHRCSKLSQLEVHMLEENLHVQMEDTDPLAETASCSVCKKYICHSLIPLHEIIHDKGVPIIYCDPCGAAFLSEESFKRHIEISGHNHEEKNVAEEIPEVVVLITEMKDPIPDASVKEEKKIIKISSTKIDCAFCEAKELTISSMGKHFANAHTDVEKALNETPDESDVCLSHCKICKEDIKDVSLHNKLHKSGLKIFKCEHCLKKLVSRGRLVNHLRTKHDLAITVKGGHTCPDCGKCYQSSKSLLIHAVAKNHAPHLVMGKAISHCIYCKKRFLRKGDLRTHQNIHKKNGDAVLFEEEVPVVKKKTVPKCNVCDKKFKSKITAEVHAVAMGHMKGYEYIEPLTCTICQKQFAKKKEFDRHVQNHKKKGIETQETNCDICGKECSTVANLQRHVGIHSKFSCVQCRLRCSTEQEMLQHVAEKHPELPELLKCNFCTQYFLEKEALRVHCQSLNHIEAQMNESVSTSLDLYFCESCEENVNLDMKEVHETIHRRGVGKFFRCSGCSKMFCSTSNLAMHVKAEHKNAEGDLTFQCPLCLNVFDTVKSLSSHHQSHLSLSEGARHLKCTFCSKTFRRAGDRHKHELIHKGIKNHQCTLCPKSFRLAYMLVLHMRTHTDERPYPCSECGLAFKSNSSMRNHMRSKHSDERTYLCTYCPKAFKTRAALVAHIGSHEQLFKCDDCGRTFPTRHAAICHIRKLHLDKNRELFQCVICNVVYGRALFLSKHMKTHAKLDGRDDLVQKLMEVSHVSEQKESSNSCSQIQATKRKTKK
ncbi:zinc finger protein 616-like [Cloeon dipterum]|uniref:zinc finger protein 616-like n=1 Tax=Cloeon dipterum TaxID=197152 RepID=UPI0032203CFC